VRPVESADAAGLYIRISRESNRRHRSAAPPFPRRLFRNAATPLHSPILKSKMPREPLRPVARYRSASRISSRVLPTPETRCAAGHANALQKLQLAARNNVRSRCPSPPDTSESQGSVRFHRETKRVRQSAKPGHQLVVAPANRRLAVEYVGVPASSAMSLSETPSQQTDSLAGEFPPDFFRKSVASTLRIDVRCFLALLRGRLAHRPQDNQGAVIRQRRAVRDKSTSRKQDPQLGGRHSCLSSMSCAIDACQKNCPSLLVVSAIPSEWNTRCLRHQRHAPLVIGTSSYMPSGKKPVSSIFPQRPILIKQRLRLPRIRHTQLAAPLCHVAKHAVMNRPSIRRSPTSWSSAAAFPAGCSFCGARLRMVPMETAPYNAAAVPLPLTSPAQCPAGAVHSARIRTVAAHFARGEIPRRQVHPEILCGHRAQQRP